MKQILCLIYLLLCFLGGDAQESRKVAVRPLSEEQKALYRRIRGLILWEKVIKEEILQTVVPGDTAVWRHRLYDPIIWGDTPQIDRVEHGSLINCYQENGTPVTNWSFYWNQEVRTGYVEVRVDFEGGVFYHSREVDRMAGYEWSPGENRARSLSRFDEIARRNGDTNFSGRIVYWPYTDRNVPECIDPEIWSRENARGYGCCLVEPMRKITISCNFDWDDNHPAGTPLDDLFEIYVPGYADLLAGGYAELHEGLLNPGELSHYRWLHGGWKRLDELTVRDLQLFPDRFGLYADTSKLQERCTALEKEAVFTVKIVLADGHVFVPERSSYKWLGCLIPFYFP